jgi:hypothetical protein
MEKKLQRNKKVHIDNVLVSLHNADTAEDPGVFDRSIQILNTEHAKIIKTISSMVWLTTKFGKLALKKGCVSLYRFMFFGTLF